MSPSRTIGFAVLLATLALGVLAATTAAQLDPRLAIVNGIPGRTVDVCIGSTEVRSNLRYGRWVERFVDFGERTIRFRAAAPGDCTGRLLAKQTLDLMGEDDFTLVGTRFPDKVVVFDNNPLPLGTAAWTRFRYAGDLGDVNLVAQTIGFLSPTVAPPPFEKGDQSVAFSSGTPFAVRYGVFKAGRPQAFRDTGWLSIQTTQRLEVIVIGSSTRNDRVVIIRRPIPILF